MNMKVSMQVTLTILTKDQLHHHVAVTTKGVYHIFTSTA
jgi:hypothetical protein